MDTKKNTERRNDRQRRHADAGPPPGCGERRINIERRLFNIDFGQGASRRSPHEAGSGQGTLG